MAPVGVVLAQSRYHADMGIDKFRRGQAFETVVAQRRRGTVGENHILAVFLKRRGADRNLPVHRERTQQHNSHKGRVEFFHVLKFGYNK